jgi:hypothetical protein
MHYQWRDMSTYQYWIQDKELVKAVERFTRAAGTFYRHAQQFDAGARHHNQAPVLPQFDALTGALDLFSLQLADYCQPSPLLVYREEEDSVTHLWQRRRQHMQQLAVGAPWGAASPAQQWYDADWQRLLAAWPRFVQQHQRWLAQSPGQRRAERQRVYQAIRTNTFAEVFEPPALRPRRPFRLPAPVRRQLTIIPDHPDLPPLLPATRPVRASAAQRARLEADLDAGAPSSPGAAAPRPSTPPAPSQLGRGGDLREPSWARCCARSCLGLKWPARSAT